MKFKGSGRFQNVTLLGDDHVLNTFYLGTSSSRSNGVEWFTGMHIRFIDSYEACIDTLDVMYAEKQKLVFLD